MFEWDGEELANIIWGKEGENEDHIVPFPDETLEKPQKPNQVDNGSQKFDNQSEDVDYGWANVGSFDDLHRILSNNEYENTNILSIESPSLQLDDLRSDCENTESKSGFTKNVNTNLELRECSGGKSEKSASSNIARRAPRLVHPVGGVNAAMPDESGIGIGIGIGIGKMDTKGQKYDPWFSLGNQGKEFEGRYSQHMNLSSSKARNQETYNQSPCGYNIKRNQQFHQSNEEQLSGSTSSLMPLRMTPQEKIEKLRRHQQMRALLAIRKQQQHEFRHQPFCNNYSNATTCSNEDKFDESLTTFVSLEKSDSDTRRMVLHQLENVISTLDVQIRVCIRDSLIRLAQSALQRQYDGDTVTTCKPNLVTRSASTPAGETKTNPIDRIVAHLLFHRPPELSLSGELLQSPSSGSTVANEGSSRGLTLL